MTGRLRIGRANTIIYCDRWRECVTFYRDGLGLDVSFENDWFVELELTEGARLSVADASRATLSSTGGQGITITLKVEDIRSSHRLLRERGLDPARIRRHAWDAEVFYVRDPDGNRIEVWSE